MWARFKIIPLTDEMSEEKITQSNCENAADENAGGGKVEFSGT